MHFPLAFGLLADSVSIAAVGGALADEVAIGSAGVFDPASVVGGVMVDGVLAVLGVSEGVSLGNSSSERVDVDDAMVTPFFFFQC